MKYSILRMAAVLTALTGCGIEPSSQLSEETDKTSSVRANVMHITFSNDVDYLVIDGAAKLEGGVCRLASPEVGDASTKQGWDPLQVYWVLSGDADEVEFSEIKGTYGKADRVSLSRFSAAGEQDPLGFMFPKDRHVSAMNIEETLRDSESRFISVKFGRPINATIVTKAVAEGGKCQLRTSYCLHKQEDCRVRDSAQYHKFSQLNIVFWFGLPNDIEFL